MIWPAWPRGRFDFGDLCLKLSLVLWRKAERRCLLPEVRNYLTECRLGSPRDYLNWRYVRMT
jgi:hypothetical protein